MQMVNGKAAAGRQKHIGAHAIAATATGNLVIAQSQTPASLHTAALASCKSSAVLEPFTAEPQVPASSPKGWGPWVTSMH